MKQELRFETKKMQSSDLGPQSCVPDLIGEHILQNDTKSMHCSTAVSRIFSEMVLIREWMALSQKTSVRS